MQTTDPMLRRRGRLHLAYRGFAHLGTIERGSETSASYALLRGVLSLAADVTSWRLIERRSPEQPADIPLVLLNSLDALLWSNLGRGEVIEIRGAAIVGVSSAVEAGYRLVMDSETPRLSRAARVALACAPTTLLCTVRLARGRRPGYGLLGWPILGASAGAALGWFRRAEGRRRERAAADLSQEMVSVARAVATAEHTTTIAWGWLVRLDHDLLAVAALDPEVARTWRRITMAPRVPAPTFARLSEIAGRLLGEEDPLLHPHHVDILTASAVGAAECSALPSPGLTRPGELLRLRIDDAELTLAPVYHRLGSELVDRVIDPVPAVLLWGGLVLVADRVGLRVPVPAVAAAIGAQWAVGALHATGGQSPGQTLRNSWLASAGTLLAGAAVDRNASTGEAAISFGGAAFSYHLLLGHWWTSLQRSQQVLGAAGSAAMAVVLLGRARRVGPPFRNDPRWWLRAMFLDNLEWWAMTFLLTRGLDHDLEEDLDVAAQVVDKEAEETYLRAYRDAWAGARQRIAARAHLLAASLERVGSQVEGELLSAMQADIEGVNRWLAEP